MSRAWKTKPVNFKNDSPEDMELYEFAGTLPNFTATIKDYLRALREKQNQPLPRVIIGQGIKIDMKAKSHSQTSATTATGVAYAPTGDLMPDHHKKEEELTTAILVTTSQTTNQITQQHQPSANESNDRHPSHLHDVNLTKTER